jgi:DNA-binding transcriptional regulator WhiA
MRPIAEELWDEWLAAPVGRAEETDSETAALFLSMKEKRNRAGMSLSSKRLFVFRRLHRLWNAGNWREFGDLGSFLRLPPDLKGHPEIHVPQAVIEKAIGISRAVHEGNPRLRWAWLRGIWGGLGSLYLPQTGYYLVFRIEERKKMLGEKTAHLLKQAGIRYCERCRSLHSDVLIRDQAQIVSFLTGLGLFRTGLLLEEKSVMRSMRNRANKLVNCDSANIRKSLDAAERQMELAERVRSFGLLDRLTPSYRELVLMRLENPSISLRELGQLLSRPVTKSTVEYRWSRLGRLVENAMKGDGCHVPWES